MDEVLERCSRARLGAPPKTVLGNLHPDPERLQALGPVGLNEKIVPCHSDSFTLSDHDGGTGAAAVRVARFNVVRTDREGPLNRLLGGRRADFSAVDEPGHQR